jgi:CelD/BcsL family acetyltransferase involved in cellulose biosynthesis
LENGLVLCRVTSWITGRRLVSLPFSDHCEPLLHSAVDEHVFISALEQALHREKLQYIELRPMQPLADTTSRCRPTQSYLFHQIDLRPDLATLFGNCHKSSTQRKIHRAEREGLIYETGRSEALLDAFWKLNLITRRRHRVPPQPVASILTLRHKDTLVYKYGCSDARFNNLGGTQLLFWRSIQEGKRDGLRVFDLGRSECNNTGLITFKDRWGSARSTLTYARFSLSPPSGLFGRNVTEWAGRLAKGVVPFLPDRILGMVGSALYRHIA